MAMFVIAYKLYINVFSPSIYVQFLKAHLQKMARSLSTISHRDEIRLLFLLNIAQLVELHS